MRSEKMLPVRICLKKLKPAAFLSAFYLFYINVFSSNSEHFCPMMCQKSVRTIISSTRCVSSSILIIVLNFPGLHHLFMCLLWSSSKFVQFEWIREENVSSELMLCEPPGLCEVTFLSMWNKQKKIKLFQCFSTQDVSFLSELVSRKAYHPQSQQITLFRVCFPSVFLV